MTARSRSPDVVVVGAGVIGAACAAALSREGLRVMLVDADFAGGGSTGVAMGHIVVLDGSEPQLALTARSRVLWSELATSLPRDCEDERRGTLWIAANDTELVAARADCIRALELEPDDATNLGMIAFIDKRPAEARRQWQSAGKGDPVRARELRAWLAKLPDR